MTDQLSVVLMKLKWFNKWYSKHKVIQNQRGKFNTVFTNAELGQAWKSIAYFIAIQ
jgi:hypothetical protein